MGGLATVIDWDRPVAAHELDGMLSLTPHRATGGTRRINFDHAVLAESFFAQDAPDLPGVVSLAHLSIVGDLRLWNRDGLRSRAGGIRITAGLDDRRLLLEAYRRTGIEFLDAVDGDFAFIIWNERDRLILAVRDRFGVKPLFYERTPSGIRFSTEAKQLAATANRPIDPSPRPIAEHLTGRYTENRLSFFSGIKRLPPATVLSADPSGDRTTRYWNPSAQYVNPPPDGQAAARFREHLADAVRRRLAGSDSAVAHLTGGHDSTSITAAAHVLADSGDFTTSLHTASAVFPDQPNDESEWIGDVAALQPFPHRDFAPHRETVARYRADMWESDTPRPAIIDGLWTGTIDTARAAGADLVLTGYGGDEVLDQSNLLADLFRQGSFDRWLRSARSYAAWSGRRFDRVLIGSVRTAVTPLVAPSIRALLRRSNLPTTSLIRRDLWTQLEAAPHDTPPDDWGFPSLTQNRLIAYVQAPRVVRSLEYDESRYAHSGLDVSHPFLDRMLVEYVASIPATRRPFDGRTKTLARSAFADRLPRSVIDRRSVTLADGYLDTIVSRLLPELRSQYPEVPSSAIPFVDSDRYVASLAAANARHRPYGDGSLWAAWTLMMWLDQLERYGTANDRAK